MAKTKFELIGLCPAEPGWRAVILNGSASTFPVVAWGVFRKRRGSRDLGTSMEGLLPNQQPHAGPIQSFFRAAEARGFGGYLPPDTYAPPDH
jgi:hypothetical protein